MTDPTSPAHYQQGDVQCIDAIKSAMPAEEFQGFLAGNAMKYLWRFRHKGGLEDLKKAKTYLLWLIDEVSS